MQKKKNKNKIKFQMLNYRHIHTSHSHSQGGGIGVNWGSSASAVITTGCIYVMAKGATWRCMCIVRCMGTSGSWSGLPLSWVLCVCVCVWCVLMLAIGILQCECDYAARSTAHWHVAHCTLQCTRQQDAAAVRCHCHTCLLPQPRIM